MEQEHKKQNGIDPPPTWEQVSKASIERELDYWRRRRAARVWLYPIWDADGNAVAHGGKEFPYSNPQRRLYELKFVRGDY